MDLNTFGWLISIVITLIVAAIVHLVARALLGRVSKRLEKRAPPPHAPLRALPVSMRLPLIALIWIVAALVIVEVILVRFQIVFDPTFLPKLRQGALVVFGAGFLLRWKNACGRLMAAKATMPAEKGQIDVGGKLLTIAILLVAALLLMEIVGINMGAIVALGGFATVGVGFAGKDVLSNFFGGMMLHITRPFQVGDAISSPDRSFEGIVEEIGWYFTQVRSLDKKPIYVPNSLFSTVVLVNSTRIQERKFEVHLTVRYADLAATPAVLQDIESFLRTHPKVSQKDAPLVVLKEYAPGGIVLTVRASTGVTDADAFSRLQQELLLAIGELVRKRNADFASLPTLIH